MSDTYEFRDVNTGNANIGGTQTFNAPVYFVTMLPKADKPAPIRVFLAYASTGDSERGAKHLTHRLYHELTTGGLALWGVRFCCRCANRLL